MYKIALFFSFLLILSCKKPDPNPEFRDLIYQDYLSQLDMTSKDITELEKQVEEQKTELKKAQPQTGEYKRAEKKIFETQANLEKIKQQKRFWQIRVKERLIKTKLDYQEAFNNNKEWPDSKEYEIYQSSKKLRLAKLSWDQKDRIKQFKENSANQQADSKNAEKKH